MLISLLQRGAIDCWPVHGSTFRGAFGQVRTFFIPRPCLAPNVGGSLSISQFSSSTSLSMKPKSVYHLITQSYLNESD